MTTKQKLLIVTLFYDPGAVDPAALIDGMRRPLTGSGDTLVGDDPFAGLKTWLERGGVVRLSHVEAELFPVTGNNLDAGEQPASTWVGLTCVPVQPCERVGQRPGGGSHAC
ncbi:MAG: hypothetical protein L0322_26005 [Chloroflexi bacterium]|nr:hypothetical protein [Chloroflexota bacterium]